MYVFSIHPTPATLDIIFLYVQFLSSMLSPSAIRNYLTGVKLLHLFSGQEFPFNKDFILLLTLRGIVRNALHIWLRAPLVTPHVCLKKSRNNTREKNIVFFHVCWYTQLHVSRLWRYSVRLMNEQQSLHDSQLQVVCWSFLELWRLKH